MRDKFPPLLEDYFSIAKTEFLYGSVCAGIAGALADQIPGLSPYDRDPASTAVFTSSISTLATHADQKYKSNGGKAVGAAAFFLGAMIGQGVYLFGKYNIPELLK